AGGNPLLVTEILRAGQRNPLGTLGSEDAIPDSVRLIASKRIAAFAPECQRLVTVAAVVGLTFVIHLLAGGVSVTSEEVNDLLTEARSDGLIEFEGPRSVRFVHGLLHSAAYEQLSAVQRSHWHLRIGSCLAQRLEHGSVVNAAEVAYHLLRAG